MKLTGKILLSIIALCVTPAAHAAVIYDTTYTASLSSIFSGYDYPNGFAFKLSGIVSGSPLFSLATYGPQPLPYNPPIHYKITLTTPSPVKNFQYGFGVAHWYDEYATIGGGVVYIGGNDNLGFGGGAVVQCDYLPCQVFQPSNKTVSVDFTYRSTYRWIPESGELIQGMQLYGTADFTWLFDAALFGDLPESDLDKNFTLSVVASTVPEPASWAILLLGFAGMGVLIRKQSRTDCIARRCRQV